MKKIFICILCAVSIMMMSSCTENARAKKYGGTITYNLPKGEKLVEVTWKEGNMWYLTEPMEEDYVPKTKKFQEKSSLGLVEGTVYFIESK